MARFVKGRSGNPRGRPKTPFNQDEFRAVIAAGVPGILKAMIAKAEGGDVQAARLVLDRVLPPIKTVDQPAPLPPAAGPVDLAGAAAAVLAALTSGEATPDQAASLASVLASLTRVKEVAELEQRIVALENRRNAEVNPQSP